MKRLTFVLTAAAGLAAPCPAQVIFSDDFAGGLDDQWVRTDLIGGTTYDPAGGRYQMTTVPLPPLDLLAAAGSVILPSALDPARYAHGVFRTAVRIDNDETNVVIAARLNDTATEGYVFAAKRGGVYDVAKLLDFGLAKPLADQSAPQITQENSITGSPLFMSPEQATGDREPDERSDIYALGVLAYYMLTGHAPFEHSQAIKVLIAHANDSPTPPSELQPDTPDDLELVVMRCLAKNPDDRYQSAAELAAALDDCEAAGAWTSEMAGVWWNSHVEPARQPEPAAVGVQMT